MFALQLSLRQFSVARLGTIVSDDTFLTYTLVYWYISEKTPKIFQYLA